MQKLDYVCATDGSAIVCHRTGTFCSPMCAFWIERAYGVAVCGDVDNSLMLCLNSTLNHPWPTPQLPMEHQTFITPIRDIVTS